MAPVLILAGHQPEHNSIRTGRPVVSLKDCKMRSSFDTIGLSQVSENAKIPNHVTQYIECLTLLLYSGHCIEQKINDEINS